MSATINATTEDRAGEPGGVGAAWRALGEWRAVFIGTAALGAAVVLGPLEAGILGFAAYQVFRDPLAATLVDEKESIVELSESVLQRVGKSLAGSAAETSFMMYVIEVAGVAYFGYRLIKRWRADRRRARAPDRRDAAR